MKITKTALRRIIKEELQNVISERGPRGRPMVPERGAFSAGPQQLATYGNRDDGVRMAELLQGFAGQICANRMELLEHWDDRDGSANWDVEMAETLSLAGVPQSVAMAVAAECDGEGCLETAFEVLCRGEMDDEGFLPGEPR